MNGGAESASDVSYASESVTGAAGACSHAEARPPPAAPWRPRAPADEVELAALLAEVRGCSRLPEVPFPTPPAFGRASLVPVSAQLWAFQQYITSLECAAAAPARVGAPRRARADTPRSLARVGTTIRARRTFLCARTAV